MKYVIVGLGNPGNEYKNTKHNTGRMVVEDFVRKFGEDNFREHKPSKSLIARDWFGIAVLPNTYMNKSGSSVVKFVKNISAGKRLVVVHDDLDLPLGKVKISFGRGFGGHKGVESVARAIKTKNFIRLRVGILPSTPKGKIRKPSGKGKVLNFIMKDFSKLEMEKLKKTLKITNEAIESIIKDGYIKAMNKFN